MPSTVADRPQVCPSVPLFGRGDVAKRNDHVRYLFFECHWQCWRIADLVGLSERQVERLVKARPARPLAIGPVSDVELSTVTARELASMATDYALDPYLSAEDREESLAFVNLMLDRMSGRPRVEAASA